MDGAESFHNESNPGTPLPIDVDNAASCVLCQRTLSGDEEGLCVCGDCKFLLLEDFSSPTRHAFGGGGRRSRRRRRRISTQTPSIIASEPTMIGGQFIASTITTAPSDDDNNNRSRRWRVMLSDSENSDSSVSIYVGSESTNASFRIFHGESSSDVNSVGGESEDDHSFLETGMIFLPSLAFSDLDSDIDDIDPMHAGLINWDWEEDEEEGMEAARIRVHSRRRRRGGFEEFWLQQESDSLGTPTPAARSFVNRLPRVLIKKSEQNDSSSNSKKEKESSDHQEVSSSSSMCAICKDLFLVGSEAIQLPCFHLYHPSCILPWLSTRNSCPLCRYELPTNELEYEESNNNGRGVLQDFSSSRFAAEAQEVEEIIEQLLIVTNDVDSSEDDDDGSHGENTDRTTGWWFSKLTAAAPIVGLMGVAFVVVLMGKPVTETATAGLNLRNQQQGRGGSRWQWRWPWF